MSNDYNDVDKLLSHMHLDGFGYRSFRKGDPAVAEAAEPVVPVQPAAPVAAEAPAPKAAAVVAAAPAAPVAAVTPPLRVVRPAEPVAVAPPAAAAAPVAAEVVAAPVQPSIEASGRVSDTLQRLMRGSITDSAPKLNLHLELPTRPAQPDAVAPAAQGERSLSEVFGKLHTAAAIKPRVISGTER